MALKTKHPCTRNCPRRTAGCKATCKEWQEYEQQKFEEYARKDEERERQERAYPFKAIKKISKKRGNY